MIDRTEGQQHIPEADCDACPLLGRRTFLRDAAAIAAGVLVALGGAPAGVMAQPIEFISALRGGRQDKSYPIPEKDGTQIDKDNDAIITRWQGKVYVFSLACPHQNTVLRWYEKESAFECPKHHSRFDAGGIYVKDSGRATRGMDRFVVKKDGNNVVANLDKLLQQDEDEADWKVAFVTV
ncbi:MAG TPA: Rieske (2Fe-2S) protein [Gemmatimonadaceae bacterium]|nr:Rieske (2Fe-2S) protein [Gemmatimonadaceae bacterium]